MSVKDYQWFLDSDKAFAHVKRAMVEHFEEFPECECSLWCGRSGGVSGFGEQEECSRCSVTVMVESSVHCEDMPELVRKTVVALMEDEGFVFSEIEDESGVYLAEDYFYLCSCCYSKLVGRVLV